MTYCMRSRDVTRWRRRRDDLGALSSWRRRTLELLEAATPPHPLDSGLSATIGLNEAYPGCRALRSRPPIFAVDDFLSADECEKLRTAAEPMLHRSATAFSVSAIRTSASCEPPLAACVGLLRKVEALLPSIEASRCERPQVARYVRGEKYDEHLDGADPATDADAEAFFFGGGQRVATVLIYLNSVASGGCTRFGRLEPPLEVAPRRGMALVFFPGDRLGRLDGRCFHEATEAADTKWVCQTWVRQASMPEAVVTIARNLSSLE